MKAGEKKRFFLGPDLEVKFTAPEECECKRKDDNEVIITLPSLPECKIYLDIVPYDQNKFGKYYFKDRNLLKGHLGTLREDIQRKFSFDPNEVWGFPSERNDSGWYRIWWRDSNDVGMEVWLCQYDGGMVRVMAGKLKEEDFPRIRKMVVDSIKLIL